MQPLVNKTLIWVAKLSVGLGLLYYIFTIIPFTEVVASIFSADGAYLALAFLVLILERFAAAGRMKILSDQAGLSLSTYKICEIGIVATFYGMFIPGDLGGGVVRWYKMSQPTKRRAEALAAITFDRLIDTITMVGLGVLFWFLDMPATLTPLIGFGLLGILLGLILVYCLALSRSIGAALLRPLERHRLGSIAAFLHSKISKVLAAVAQFRQLPPERMIVIWGLSFARLLLAIGIKYLLALALGINISFMVIGWAHCLITIATMIPVSFSGLGIREGAMVVLLQPYGVSGSSAVALAFLILIMNILIAAAGGLLEIKNVLHAGRRSPVVIKTSDGK